MKKIINQTLAVIPAYNEQGSVGVVVSGVRRLGMEVLVVDDNSLDRTRDEAMAGGARVLSLASRLGAWGAIQAGLRYALQNKYEYTVTLDADGQHLPETIPDLLRQDSFKEYDVIIGSCPERVSRMRRFAWTLFRRTSCTDFDDLTSGLRVYNRRAMRLLLDKSAYLFDYQDMGALLLLKKHGLRINEVPVKMLPRKIGHSRVFNNWFKVCRYMAVTTSLSASKFRQKTRKKK
jgi:glycosyltransferase involved in cell wall biosynthesis